MRDFLRFLFSPADVARIDATTIQIDEVAAAPANDDGPPLQSLRVRFTVTNTAAGAPQLIPLIPGRVHFQAAAAAVGVSPAPNDVELTSAKYATWKTEGRLRVHLENVTMQKELKGHIGTLEVLPTHVWYAPIKITETFLFNSLAPTNALKRSVVHTGTTDTPTGASNWAKYAVSGFLKGTYKTELRVKTTSTNASDDDVEKFALPTVVMDANGNVELFVTVGRGGKATDGNGTAFDAITPTANSESPAHAKFGLIPARHVYRLCRAHMLNAAAGNAVADPILLDWPNARKFATIQFTRTWTRQLLNGTKVENYSIQFPSQTVLVANANATKRLEMRLPAHGFVFVPRETTESTSAAINVKVSISAGDMRLLNGATATNWRVPATTTPVAIDLVATPASHILARRPMSAAILDEPVFDSSGARCTYFSLRRSVRALVDNRIAGGRLNFDVSNTSKATEAIIAEAWAGTGVTVGLISDGKPAWETPDMKKAQEELGDVLSAFFPDVPTLNPAPATPLKKGVVGYLIWITSLSSFNDTGKHDNFTGGHMGRGGAGALVYLGLATNYAFNSDRQAGETINAYYHRLATGMRGIKPGAALQFWDTEAQFILCKAGNHPCPPVGNFCGHSPLCAAVNLPAENVELIDQFGRSAFPFSGTPTDRRLKWDGHDANVWFAADWNE